MLPSEMPLQRRPHFLGKLQIARPHQVSQQHVHEHHIHVVMVVREVAARVQHPLLAREVDVRIPRPNRWIARRHRRYVLPLQPMPNLLNRTIMVPQRVQVVWPTPPCQHRSPSNAAMQHALVLLIPDRLRRDPEVSRSGVHILIRSVDFQCRGDRLDLRTAFRKRLRRIVRHVRHTFASPVDGYQQWCVPNVHRSDQHHSRIIKCRSQGLTRVRGLIPRVERGVKTRCG